MAKTREHPNIEISHEICPLCYLLGEECDWKKSPETISELLLRY